MSLDLPSLIIGVLIGWLATVAVGFPRIGRVLARATSVVALAAGVGVLVWAIDVLVRGNDMRPLGWTHLNISSPSEALGTAAGLLAAGVAALVLSFIGRS